MKKFVALLTKEKWPRINVKMSPTFFYLHTLYIKHWRIIFPYFTRKLVYAKIHQFKDKFKKKKDTHRTPSRP